MWDLLIVRLLVLITLGVGSILIVLFPILHKTNEKFALLSLVVGSIIIFILMLLIFDTPEVRQTILGE